MRLPTIVSKSTKWGECRKLLICTPPGSAKSTYTSKLFPPFFLAQDDLIRHGQLAILACSYSKDLIAGFGRWNRNIIAQKGHILGYELAKDSKAADEWETSTGGLYFCAGVGAGLAGHRADFGLIDDPIGSEEETASANNLEKLWSWYVADFLPRLKPGAVQVIIANRRHEDDLIGRIQRDEPGQWREVIIPLVAKAQDLLGRKEGDVLWPEYWNAEEQVQKARKKPHLFSGLWQQEPAPESGNFYQAADLVTYDDPGKLPQTLRLYGGSDHACSEEEGANRTCLLTAGVDVLGDLWIHPDLFWKECDTNTTVNEWLRLMRRHQHQLWWAEKGHISKSIGPFLRQRMLEELCFVNIQEVTSTHDKVSRARSMQARTSQRKVHFPSFAPWWPDARHELLMFPNGKYDDFVDALSEIGMGLDKMSKAVSTPSDPEWDRAPKRITLKWMKQSAKDETRARELALSDR